MTLDELRATAAARHETCTQIKKMIVSRLDLPIEPAWITDDQPLFGRGLELDSLDVLELYVAIEAEFGVALYDSDMSVFGSVSRLADHVNPALAEQAQTGSA
ncbi:acyl carrier protein [Lentzea fradiae]|uniref:Acyl carrier protein n=1 Tax=Lentzea fradiae TaxID=200378 RepID=A0A1G7L5A2_9PSEU|nr:phosphopantetheine-binding protein [Lentzea fradiae]SDF44687.1 acyl carrier protein [Lentzea fradiae]